MSDEVARAREILHAAHLAWTKRDLPTLLGIYHERIQFSCNLPGPDGEPLKITGRAGMEAFLRPILDVVDNISVVELFDYKDGVGRASVACSLRHRATGHTLAGQYRQVVRFLDGQILALEEYHDAARLAAFWKLVEG